MKKSVVAIDPKILNGTAIFAGTIVPVQGLIDNFKRGRTLDAFLDENPSVSREQAVAFLRVGTDRLIESIREAAR
jgi:uncharacterized protein (DUF433 family)